MNFFDILHTVAPGGLNIFGLFQTEISLPNLPIRAPDPDAWYWSTVAKWNGLRLQQNCLDRHARIIDANNVRIAWGTFRGMEMVLERLNKYYEPLGR